MARGPRLRVALAVNPASGQGRGKQAGAVAQHHLAAAGIDVDVLIGKDAADLAGQLQHVLSRPGESSRETSGKTSGQSSGEDGRADTDDELVAALVVAGGDGMVQLGVTALARAGWPVPLGIIPAGTGNDVARALGLALGDVAAAADAVIRALSGAQAADGSQEPSTRAIDAVRCTPGTAGSAGGGDARWFTGVLGAGFDALVNERANGWRWPRGRARYVLAMLRELPRFQPRHYVITMDGQEWRTPAMLVAVANAPSYGGGMRVCPDAQLDDGLLDVLVVRPVSKAAFLRIFPRVYAGTHVSDQRVEIRRARTVVIDAHIQHGGIVGYADGERIAALPLRCELMPGVLRVLTG